MRPKFAHLATALVLAIGGVASADPTAGDIQLDTFRPAIDSRGYLTINASQVLGDKEVSFGLGSLSWGHRLLAFENGTATYSVDDVVTATLIAAIGLHVGPAELELGAAVPLSIIT